MSEVGAHHKIQHPSESILPAGRDEEYRMKVATLRDEVLQVLYGHGISLGSGVFNHTLLNILSQVLGNRSTEVTYVEDLKSDWHDVYLRVVKQIAALMPHCEFDVGKEPKDIVRFIEQRLTALSLK